MAENAKSEAKETLAIHPLEGYAVPVGYALACLEKECERTRETVADLSVKALDARAKGFPNSIGTLLYHVAAIELDWLYCEILEQDVPDDLMSLFPVDVRDEEGRLSKITGAAPAEHLHRLDAVRRALFDNLKDVDEEDFYRLRRLDPYDVNPAWVLYHLLEHEAKHGEQMAHIRRALT